MAELDKLVKCMERLDAYLDMKSHLLLRDCHQLEELLRPWKTQLHPKEAEITESSQIKDSSSNTNDTVLSNVDYEPIDEDLQRVDRLLAKVQKVRNTVKDTEILVKCQIKPSSLTTTTGKSGVKSTTLTVATGKTGIKCRSTNPPKSIASKEMQPTSKMSGSRAANKSRSTPPVSSAPSNQTSYQRAYKAPHLTRHVRSSNYGIKSATKQKTIRNEDQSQVETIKKAVTVPQSNGNVPTNSKAREIVNIQHDSTSVFSLQTNGCELKVPRALRQQMKLNRALQNKLHDLPDKFSHHIPERLFIYYKSLQEDSVSIS